MKIKISITDDLGKIYEGMMDLSDGKNKNIKIRPTDAKLPYKKGSVSDRIMKLINGGFFANNKTINDIIKELKSSDYHYKPADLTNPLRRIVRKGLLKKTKTLLNGTESKKWTFIKA